MTYDEGYIKYESAWAPGPPPAAAVAEELDRWRHELFVLGLIGYDGEHEVGYGNISIHATQPGQFYISGTQTGHLEHTDRSHYTLVTSCDIQTNRVTCCGPVEASSEAMTHAAIYRVNLGIRAVVHVHSAELWKSTQGVLPTTNPAVAYGTPAMADEFRRLYVHGHLADVGIAVMAGHEGGLISFGATLEHAATRILSLARRSIPARG
ncbi:MAG: class II aldolase/adducin family protein [Woeseiaceae bacterium]|nr:class II aldolase/adducin family protein [Woeseiaceae bacterium]